ncbi:ribose-phosphate diphosphokinase [Pyrofollis japonicus]|uniref:ribose-phosphate diphosphokinase n=1 Tax=Pyrofollis japonicus TaxID=3060460 RepID=UPI00295B93C9|nr:ribose-phosphate pyrophosphokinase [Pyrofollis japonicus]BEP16774.1 ribose-phosphate diphosphokinase [Pyrofollis japonicus]
MTRPSLFFACLGYACEAARSAAKTIGADLVEASWKQFPDGEAYVRVAGAPEGVGVAVFTGFPEPSTRIVEGMLLIEALRGLGAASVVAAPLYLAYSRQDRRFLRGEPISIRAVLRALASAGAEALATIDIHKQYSLEWFPGPAANIDPSPVFAEALRPVVEEAELAYVIAPDKGALPRAKSLGEKLGLPFDHLEKHRDRVTGEITMKPKKLDAKGATIIIVDDIVSTGGTLAKAAKLLLDQGATRVYAAITHCLLVGNAVEKLEESGLEKLYCTNTVKPRWSKAEELDVGPLLARSVEGLIERLHGYEAEQQ